jgi:hypothetical protein
MKAVFSSIISFLAVTLYGQSNNIDYRYKNFDSIVVQTFYESGLLGEVDMGSVTKITGRAKLKSKDAKTLNQWMRQKEAYGESQAMTPEYDLRWMYYKHGKVIETVQVSLWTNNLYASFPLRVQRQGECMCGGTGGYCCSKGGISMGFKKQLIALLEKCHLPVDREGILRFGE